MGAVSLQEGLRRSPLPVKSLRLSKNTRNAGRIYSQILSFNLDSRENRRHPMIRMFMWTRDLSISPGLVTEVLKTSSLQNRKTEPWCPIAYSLD